MGRIASCIAGEKVEVAVTEEASANEEKAE